MTTTPNRILENKLYLYLTEFLSGMAVMAVELAASRLIAPYFSSSQIVWTIIIATIMIAMALGNIWGGRQADRWPDPARLYKRLMIAGLWIAAIPVLGKYLIVLISGLLVLAVDTNYLIWAAFITCMVIFVYPLFLLGTVTPSLVKYTVSNLADTGTVVGRLGAYNTVGSIIGTFLPTFVTIPAVGTAITFLIFAGSLLILGAIYFISEKKKTVFTIVMLAAYVLCIVFGCSGKVAFWEDDLTYEGESVYNYLQVKDSDSSTVLSTNVMFGVQSIRKKDSGLTGMYYDYALAAPLLASSGNQAGECLVLGMGTGTYAMQCRNYFPQLTTTGVDIDEKITGLARQYFALDNDIMVYTYDGRAFLNSDTSKYDVIMVDAYRDITIPFSMSTVEFFTAVKQHLTPNGVMVINMNMYSQVEDSINDYLGDTVSAVFPYVYTIPVTGSTNMELFATSNAMAIDNFDSQIAAMSDTKLQQFMRTVKNGLTVYTPSDQIMTDDKAPVEVLGMRVIDDLIANELYYFRQRFWQYGISGILG